MTHSFQQLLTRWLCRLYSLSLYAYPRDFRQRYGSEMAQVFRDRCRHLAQTRNPRDWFRFSTQIGADWLTTTVQERISSMRADNPSLIRVALLTGISFSLAMMATKVFLYRPLLAIPGGRAFFLETTGLLVLYVLLVLWATRSADPLRRAALLSGTPLGVIGGAIQIAHLTQETFRDLGPVWNGVSGFGLLFCTFLCWGAAGYRTTRRTGALRSGAMAGFWSAIVTMSILVVFGFALEFYLAMPKPEYVAMWGEFQRSGWTDIHAFTIANTLDAAQSHLIAGPIIGAIVGGIAGGITRMQHKQQPKPAARPA